MDQKARYQAIQLALSNVLRELSLVEVAMRDDLRTELKYKRRTRTPKLLRRIVETIRSEAEEGKFLCLNAIMSYEESGTKQ